jgi:hypothetical protein
MLARNGGAGFGSSFFSRFLEEKAVNLPLDESARYIRKVLFLLSDQEMVAASA